MEIDVLTIGRPPSTRPARPRIAVLSLVAVVIGLLVVTGLADPTSRTERALVTLGPATRQILLLGDSSAGNDTCLGWCVTYIEQLAQSIEQHSPKPVKIEDRSWRGNVWPPASVHSVLAYLRTDSGLRDAVRSTDILVLALTHHEVRGTRNASADFAEQLDTLLLEVSDVRQHRPIVLRLVVAPWPSESSNRPEVNALDGGCQVARSRQAVCVNLFELGQRGLLTAEDWTLVAHRPWLSQHGHDVVAHELIAAGVPDEFSKPVR